MKNTPLNRLHAAGLLLPVIFLAILAGCGEGKKADSETGLRAALAQNPADVQTRVSLARSLTEKDSYQEAIALLIDGDRLEPKNRKILAELGYTYGNLAYNTSNRKKFEVAERYWQEAIELGGNGYSYHKLGWVQNNLDKYSAATETLEIGRQIANDHADMKGQLGLAYRELGKYEKALPVLLEATEKAPKYYLYWWWLGDVQRLSGDYEAGLASFEKALSICPKSEKADLRENIDYTMKLLSKRKGSSVFWAHWNLADRHEKLARQDRRTAEYEAALTVVPEDLYGGNRHEKEGWIHLCNAQFYAHVQNFDEALKRNALSFDAYKRANSPKDLSFVFNNRNAIYASLAAQKPEMKEEFCEKQLEAIEKEIFYAEEGDFFHMVEHAWANKGSTMSTLYGFDDERTQECRNEMVKYLPENASMDNCAFAGLAEVEAGFLAEEGNYDKATQLYEAILPHFTANKDIRTGLKAPRVLNSLSYIARKQERYEDAIIYAERAVKELLDIRARLGVDQFKQRTAGFSWTYAFVENKIKAAIALSDAPRTFDFCEEYKGRVLLDLLASKGTKDKRSDLKDKRLQRKVVLAKMRNLENEVSELPSSDEKSVIRSLQRDLEIEKTNYERLNEDISAANREVKNFESVASLGSKDLQPIMKDFTFVSYVVGEKYVAAVIATHDSIEAITLEGVNQKKIERKMGALRRQLGLDPGNTRDLALETDEESATAAKKENGDKPKRPPVVEELYDLLIEPILPYLKTELVYISPDGMLNNLPFEALRKDGRYLIEDFAIAYAPSANVLKHCMEVNPNQCKSVLALGNPNLKNPAFRLINAEKEVLGLDGLFEDAGIFTFDDATETIVREIASEYDILHFACHGELNRDEPMLTSLRLAPDEENDGYLHAGEVFDLDLRASLVVLSACNSGIGEINSGNELMGLTRSFLYAGSSSVIASLWTVDDRSTAYLMQQFYSNLATMDKARALRQAKLATMKQYPEPFHWAAFCLQGDYQ